MGFFRSMFLKHQNTDGFLKKSCGTCKTYTVKNKNVIFTVKKTPAVVARTLLSKIL